MGNEDTGVFCSLITQTIAIIFIQTKRNKFLREDDGICGVLLHLLKSLNQ